MLTEKWLLLVKKLQRLKKRRLRMHQPKRLLLKTPLLKKQPTTNKPSGFQVEVIIHDSFDRNAETS